LEVARIAVGDRGEVDVVDAFGAEPADDPRGGRRRRREVARQFDPLGDDPRRGGEPVQAKPDLRVTVAVVTADQRYHPAAWLAAADFSVVVAEAGWAQAALEVGRSPPALGMPGD